MGENDRASEREKRKAEAREAQAMLDSLEPGSDQAAKLIESASRKGIKLRVRHTLVDRTAIESLADGLRRDYEQHQAELREQRRSKLLRVGAALGVAMLVAAAVVVLSGLFMRPSSAPTPSAALDPEARADAAPRARGVTAAPRAPAETPPLESPPPRAAAKPAPEQCPAPPSAAAPPQTAPPTPKTAEPTRPSADPSPKPAPSNKIEPYFGATP
jgi:hypothetical protein